MSDGPILVSGAAGFIAYHLIHRLLGERRPVVGVDNFDPFYDRRWKERNLRDLRQRALEQGTSFTFLEGSVEDPGFDPIGRAAPSVIVHLAARAGVRPSMHDPAGYTRANVLGTAQLLASAHRHGVRPFVLGSSSSVYGDATPVPFQEDAPADRPLSPYAVTKRSAELLASCAAHVHGLTVATLRFFTVYGARARPDMAIPMFTRRISAGSPISIFGSGDTQRDYTFVSDVVEGICSAVSWVGREPAGRHRVFNLGSARPVALLHLVALIERSVGRAALLEHLPPQLGDARVTLADITRAQLELGYRPAVSLEEGIRRFVESFQLEATDRLTPG